VYEFEIDLGHIAIVLAPGHRLRLAISSSDFDRFDINPNTGETYGDHSVTRELLSKRFRGYEGRGEPQYVTVNKSPALRAVVS
jgi:predicted acyl esterase